ncbi:death-associated inhibitor of apoptosis 1-like [Cydia fagiglandana]|uniref:death-associated inhibitor of apoptosis 1-like n=1 Tax=Cydia fagiglandana TaxID=1458189 RepID=UPI002FEDE8DC
MTTGQDECGMCAPPATGASVLPKPHPHPRYNNKAARLRIFEDWPKSMKQKPEELAEAGFYYTGQSDKTKCFYCDGGLKDWEEDDVPWEQHARWFDRCAYVQLVKGEDYVQKVMSSQKGKVIIAPNKASNSASTSQAHSGTGAMITIIITVDTTGQKATTRTVQWATKTPGQDECGMCAPPATGASVLPKPHPHPRYNNKAARLRTFEDWPKSMKQKPEELAEAGFYYTGQSDKTMCFYCDGGLKACCF